VVADALSFSEITDDPAQLPIRGDYLDGTLLCGLTDDRWDILISLD